MTKILTMNINTKIAIHKIQTLNKTEMPMTTNPFRGGSSEDTYVTINDLN